MAATLFDGTAREQQWQLHHLQLINWGTFDGAARVNFACNFQKPAVTVVCGESGTGKSTMQDAYDEVMMRSPQFNAASNKGGGRNSAGEASGKRTLVSYVRGVVDSEYDEAANMQRERALRDASCARWTAIGAVFVDGLGNYFTAARAYYLLPESGGIDRDNTWFITANEELDLGVLEKFAARKFDKRAIASVLPRARQHEGRTDFLDCVYRSLGIGGFEKGRELMGLLAKIRAGQDFSSVSSLFRELVLERPETYEAADKAIEEFDNHTKVYEKLRKSAEQRRMLEPIVEHKEAYDNARELAETCVYAGSLDDAASPMSVWLKARHEQVVGEVYADAQKEREAAAAQLEDAKRWAQEAKAQVKQLEARVEEAGGGKAKTLEARIEASRNDCVRKKDAYDRLAAGVACAGWEIPQNGEAYEQLVAQAQEHLRSYEEKAQKAVKERDTLVVRESKVTEDAEGVRRDLEYYAKHRSNISRQLSEARDMMAAAAGMDPKDLPFVAELMEVAAGDEQWRQAIEIVLRPLARSVLVDKKQLAHFRRSVDAIDARKLGVRVHHHGVDLSDASFAQGRPGGIAQKIKLDRKSVFAPWLSRVLADENHDALCVEKADDLRGDDLRVTRSGQTSQGLRGAHGRGAKDSNVIGFSNEAKVAQLRQRLTELNDEATRLREQKSRLDGQRKTADAIRTACQRVIETPFAEVDVAGAQRELAELQQELQAFLEGNARLAELKTRLLDAEKRRDERVKAQGAQENNLARCEQDLATLESLQRNLAGSAQAAANLPQELVSHIAKIAADKERSYGSARDLHGNYGEFMRQVGDKNKNDGANAAHKADDEKKALEAIFSGFQERWPNPNRGVGIDSFDDYAVILEELVYQDIDAHEAQWKARMLTWIRSDLMPLRRAFDLCPQRMHDRIDPINVILSGLSFGADGGKLRLSLQELESSAVKEFKQELSRLTSNATAQDFDPASFYEAVGTLLDKIRVGARDRDALLDRRRHVKVTAKVAWPAELGRKDSCYDSLAGKSGGEVQELVAFLSASALLYKLGAEAGRKPVFAPVMLDEGFGKADSKFTARAVEAWKSFGFQLLVVTSQNNFQSVADAGASACAYMTKGPDGVSRVSQLVLEEGEAIV